jgi:hypothetical protein
MERQHRATGVGFAVVLILLGVWFLGVQFFPPLQNFANAIGNNWWPLLLILIGGGILIDQFFRRSS